jgi:23S rRNA (pseudouridine1915-N3)-methyltransferase
MLIQIIAVGKIKEQFLRDGIAEYEKRLRPYCRVEIVEVQDEKLPDSLSGKKLIQALEREGDRISHALNQNSLVVALDIDGLQWTSEEFARQLAAWEIEGRNQIAFVIGGAMGLSGRLREEADIRLSLSPMTFTHQMSRLIVLEQIYRAFRICRGEPYHK